MKKIDDNPPVEGSSALMADVARLAGVATSTVSRALANPGRVNEKTRARIAAAAEQLGYTPNAAARNLRVGKSNVIMIILPGSLHYGASQIIPQVLDAVNRTLIRNGYNLMIANLDRDESSERHILDLAFGGTVRGALILSSQLPVVANRSLAEAGLPIVSLLLDMSDTAVPSIVTNDRQAVREVARELLALGHRRFFYIAGPTGNYHDIERYAGLVEALQEAGLSEEYVTRSGGELSFQFGFETGLRAAEEFSTLTEKPTAVVATSDDMAISFMSRVQKMGWRVPNDLSIVSFDGSPVCEYCAPPLSTIEQPMEALGETAAELLIRWMADIERPEESRIVIPSRIIRRESISQAPSATALGEEARGRAEDKLAR
ncbi:LacI family transcriptional regulator [Rhizobium sp. AC44/96]|uniref:LacI family DNA-binding transcriptional regulator n=1 Tax=unclassified Rhizobium TaxID=2613769 RepID=UPI00080F73C5|nr:MULTISPECIES: LacI family DNA-binding transcriptional regulator [unclassified Rhizobium]MDM9622866.1 LacI family DNA-binding transcriptional regulator [Rhizobium sp. S96]OCJ13428.1 LacI family transcriptional regulator [Rhizobium sp. AC44/96]